MTMEIEVKNISQLYVAEVTMWDNPLEGPPVPEDKSIELQPGESAEILVWKGHYPVIKEIGEVPHKEETPQLGTSEDQIETMIQEKGLNAPRLTPEMIDAKIKGKTFTNLPSGKCVVCEITLANGFTVRGESAVVSPENFDQEVGNIIAFKNARDKIWQIEGYLLQEQVPC